MKNIILSTGLLITTLISTCYGQGLSSCYGAPNGYFMPNFTDCSKYFTCMNNVGYGQNCPTGFNFDIAKQGCVPVGTAQCISCAANQTGLTFLTITGICDKYVVCIDGVAMLQACLDGTRFNTENNQCDLPANVQCSSAAAPCPQTKNSLTFVGINCSEYTMCFNGVGYVQSCASGLVFNPSKNGCVLAANYQCPATNNTSQARSIKHPIKIFQSHKRAHHIF